MGNFVDKPKQSKKSKKDKTRSKKKSVERTCQRRYPLASIKVPKEWERLDVTPSQIPDDKVTDRYVVPSMKFKTDADVFKERGFAMLKKIGEGGYGVVKEGVNLKNNESVAIKQVDYTSMNRIRDAKNELYMLVKLRHTHIVAIYDHFNINESLFIVMELASGSLSDYVKNNRPLTENDAKQFFRQIVSGIHFMHSKGVSHNDLKLGNVLMFEGKTPETKVLLKITDFGMSRISYCDSEGVRKQKNPVGTRMFMSPQIIKLKIIKDAKENDDLSALIPKVSLIGRFASTKNVVKRKKYDPFAADIWALGVILFVLATKNYPFGTKDKLEQFTQQMLRLYSYPPTVRLTDLCKDLIGQMLEPNPIQRITIKGVKTHSWLHSTHDAIALSL